MSVLNGIVVIYWALLTNKRVFGFAGIMYVDYAGITLTACLIYLLYGKKFKIILTLSFIIVLMALIFTQTRNAWISTGLTLLLVFSHYIFFNKSLKIALSKKIFLFCFVLFTTTMVSIQALNLNPKAYSRIETDISKSKRGEVKINTFITRLFIWQTAFNAFQQHPITGIGLYSFSNHSSEYNTLPPIIYEEFVEDLSPHQTFIQILCETGLIGFVGFIYFLFNYIKISRYNLKISISPRELLYANIFFWISFYIIISMFMTDGWLQGQGLILWSLIIGSTLAIAKIIEKKNV